MGTHMKALFWKFWNARMAEAPCSIGCARMSSSCKFREKQSLMRGAAPPSNTGRNTVSITPAERLAELRRLLSEAHAYGGLPRELRERIRVALAKSDRE